MKLDIANRTDITKIVDQFYNKIKEDKLLGTIFTDVAHVNWEKHLPKMYDFWEFILLKTGEYNGRPFPPHLALNHVVPLKGMHFERWLSLFHQTINDLFEGKKQKNLNSNHHN